MTPTTVKITCALNFPTPLVPGDGYDPSTELPPKQLKRLSLIPPETTRDINGVTVILRQWNGPALERALVGDLHEPAALIFKITLDSGDPITEIEDLAETIIDDLSFQLQAPLSIIWMEAVDITPPVSIGEERETTLFATGYSLPKARRFLPINYPITTNQAKLRANYTFSSESSSKHSASSSQKATNSPAPIVGQYTSSSACITAKRL